MTRTTASLAFVLALTGLTGIAAPAQKPRISYESLSLNTRQEIYAALLAAQNRAIKEARAKYPNPDPSRPGYNASRAGDIVVKQTELQQSLMRKYVRGVVDKYNITQFTAQRIAAQGMREHWPTSASVPASGRTDGK
jgi:hypothetical protein